MTPILNVNEMASSSDCSVVQTPVTQPVGHQDLDLLQRGEVEERNPHEQMRTPSVAVWIPSMALLLKGQRRG